MRKLHARSPSHPPAVLRLEQLEDRRLLSAGVLGSTLGSALKPPLLPALTRPLGGVVAGVSGLVASPTGRTLDLQVKATLPLASVGLQAEVKAAPLLSGQPALSLVLGAVVSLGPPTQPLLAGTTKIDLQPGPLLGLDVSAGAGVHVDEPPASAGTGGGLTILVGIGSGSNGVPTRSVVVIVLNPPGGGGPPAGGPEGGGGQPPPGASQPPSLAALLDPVTLPPRTSGDLVPFLFDAGAGAAGLASLSPEFLLGGTNFLPNDLDPLLVAPATTLQGGGGGESEGAAGAAVVREIPDAGGGTADLAPELQAKEEFLVPVPEIADLASGFQTGGLGRIEKGFRSLLTRIDQFAARVGSWMTRTTWAALTVGLLVAAGSAELLRRRLRKRRAGEPVPNPAADLDSP